MTNKETKLTAKILERHFASHHAPIEIIGWEVVDHGERIIFDINLTEGTREKLVFARANDIRTSLRIPILQPFKNGLALRLALSLKPITENSLTKMLNNTKFPKDMQLPIALGYDLRGDMYYCDLQAFPHALYAGTTGSGKSSGIQSLILSLATKKDASEVGLILVDTVADSLNVFAYLPHLLTEIIKQEEKVIHILKCLCQEMQKRINLSTSESNLLPPIVCIIDEVATLVSNLKDMKLYADFKHFVSNLLRVGRHANIHLIFVTQDATKEELGINLNNLNARIAFKTTSFQNSVTLLNKGGAENLPGKGAMIFRSLEQTEPIYLQGAFIEPNGIEELLKKIRATQRDNSARFVTPEFDTQSSEPANSIVPMLPYVSKDKEELAKIVMWSLGRETVAATDIMNNFHMSNRVKKIMDQLVRFNLITGKNSNQHRMVVPSKYEDLSEETKQLLDLCHFTHDQIQNAFTTRGGRDL